MEETEKRLRMAEELLKAGMRQAVVATAEVVGESEAIIAEALVAAGMFVASADTMLKLTKGDPEAHEALKALYRKVLEELTAQVNNCLESKPIDGDIDRIDFSKAPVV